MRDSAVGGIVTLVLILFATPLAAQAQQQSVPRIGWLIAANSTSPPTLQAVAAFRQGLRDLGHVEGQNVFVEYRFADGGLNQLPALAAELVSLKVDVIVTDGSPATQAAQQGTKTIPIVMAFSAAPVEQGFVASLAKPGGNITGISMLLPELAKKRLELLKILVPKATRVAVLRAPLEPNAALQWRATEEAARLLGVELQVMEVQRSTPDYDRVFDTASRGRADALLVLPDSLFARDRTQIIALAAKHRLPAMYFERMFAESGGLVSYGPSIPKAFRQAASYVDKILKGAKPGSLPVEQPKELDLILNQTTANALGITFPPTLRALAAEELR